jgi:hypothetical protein
VSRVTTVWELPRTPHPNPAVEAQLQRILTAQAAIKRRQAEADAHAAQLAAAAEQTRRRPGMPKTNQMQTDAEERVRPLLAALEAQIGALHDEIGALMDKIHPDDLAYLYPLRAVR